MDPFWLRVALSFVLGGLAVALFTTAAERLGSRVGGLLLSFPVKVTIALLLIGLNEGATVASEAAAAVPLGLGINLVFLVAAALFVPRLPPWPALGAALAVWLVAGVAGVLLVPGGVGWSVGAWLVAWAAGLAILWRTGPAAPRKREAASFGVVGLLTRAAGAGAIVALAVILARVGGPLLGGLASVFPSGWITTMVILSRHHGAQFTQATIRVMVAASVSPVLFGLGVWALYPTLGAWLGTLAAIGAALATSIVVAWALRAGSRPASS